MNPRTTDKSSVGLNKSPNTWSGLKPFKSMDILLEDFLKLGVFVFSLKKKGKLSQNKVKKPQKGV